MTPAQPLHPRRRFWAQEDRKVLKRLVLGFVATALLPRRLDRWFVPKLTRRKVPARRLEGGEGMTEVERRMRFVLEPINPALDFRALAAQFDEMRVELDWLRARALHGGKPPVCTSVEGVERLSLRDDAASGGSGAVSGGSGAVLWGMSFCGTLVVKMALSRAGISLVHLSEVGHGGAYPVTTFGARIVSPFYCKPENRYLLERVSIPVDGSLGYLRTLMGRLEEGHVVYLAGERLARRRNTSAICLGRSTEFARGAPALAHRTGVPLAPVTVWRDGPSTYRAVIEEPIDVDRSLPRDRFVERAIREFAARVSRNVLAHPADWDWYHHTVPGWEAKAWGEEARSPSGDGQLRSGEAQ